MKNARTEPLPPPHRKSSFQTINRFKQTTGIESMTFNKVREPWSIISQTVTMP